MSIVSSSLISGWSYTPFVDLVGVLVVAVLLAVLAAAALRGRNSAPPRPGPELYFGYGLSLLCILVAVISVGIGVNAVTELVGPTPVAAGFAVPSCVEANSASSGCFSNCVVTHYSSNGDDGDEVSQCADPLGTTTRPLSVYPSPVQSSSSSAVALAPVSSEQTNHEISVAVAAGLFALVGGVGWLLVWPRTRRADGAAGDIDGSEIDPGNATLSRLGNAYRYLVAGLAGITLLVIVPVTADSVFRAIAPGVNQTSGHAPGVRDLVTFAALSLLLGAVLVYHLRVAPSPPAATATDPASPTEQ